MTGAPESITLLTIPQTAKAMGCSPDTVYRRIASGEIETIDIAEAGSRTTKLRVHPDALAAYYKNRGRQPRLRRVC